MAERRVVQANNTAERPPDRCDTAKIKRGVQRDAGPIPGDHVRSSLIRMADWAGLHVTWPKSWRHTLATLSQVVGVDLRSARRWWAIGRPRPR